MKKIVFAALLAALCISCGRQSTATVEGTVVDAAMNNVILDTSDGEMVVNTAFSDPNKVEGVLIGDVVKVVYTEQTDGGVTVNNACSLEVVVPSYYRLIAGTWVAENGGLVLAEDGTAEGQGAAPSDIRNYVLDGEELAITSGTKDEPVTVVYTIEKLDADSLVLRNNETQAIDWSCARKQAEQ